MAIADLNQVEKQLSDLFEKERKEAIGYSVMIVLCTPFFLFVAGCIVFLIFIPLLDVMRWEHDLSAIDIYTFLNIFLALMMGIILRLTFSPDSDNELNITWLTSVIIFLLLLFLTYGTKFPEYLPVAFGVTYTITGFFILGLLGRIYFDLPISQYDQSNDSDPINSFILLLSGFIFRAYGEMFSSSWLWSPPNKDKIKMCAWFLLMLEKEKMVSIESSKAEHSVLGVLFRLKLIEKRENMIVLAQKGLNIINSR